MSLFVQIVTWICKLYNSGETKKAELLCDIAFEITTISHGKYLYDWFSIPETDRAGMENMIKIFAPSSRSLSVLCNSNMSFSDGSLKWFEQGVTENHVQRVKDIISSQASEIAIPMQDFWSKYKWFVVLGIVGITGGVLIWRKRQR
jgi:hypothetical protein